MFYHKKREIISTPGPGRKLFGLNITIPYYRNYLNYLVEINKQYGDMAYFKAGSERIFLVNNLEYIEEILIKNPGKFLRGTGFRRARIILGEGLLSSDGETHDRHRRLIQPAFHKQAIESYFSKITDCTNETVKEWNEKLKHQDFLDIHDETGTLFLKIICRVLFSGKYEKELTELGILFNKLFYNYGLFLIAFPGFTQKLGLPAVRKFMKAKDDFNNILFELIGERKSSPAAHNRYNDVLAMMINAKDNDGKGLSDKEIRDELATLFFAAYDTSAKTLTWTLYLLSQNNPHKEKLDRETGTAFPAGNMEYNEYKNCKYPGMVISEALRIYPPAHSINRVVAKDICFGKHFIPQGSSIIICPYILQRNSSYFENPLEFRPERWDAGEVQKRPRLSYIPFGAGARGCIGEALARLQLGVSLAAISRGYDFEVYGNEPVEVSASLTLKPKRNLKMIFKKK